VKGNNVFHTEEIFKRIVGMVALTDSKIYTMPDLNRPVLSSFPKPHGKRLKPALLSSSAVCKAWHDSITSNSQAYSCFLTFLFTMEKNLDCFKMESFNKYKEWLAASDEDIIILISISGTQVVEKGLFMDMCKFILQQKRRWLSMTVIHITTARESCNEVRVLLHEFSRGVFPRLRRIRLAVTGAKNIDQYPHNQMEQSPILPLTLGMAVVPSLEALILKNVDLNLSHLIGQSLVIWKYSGSETASPPNLSDLLNIFRSSPFLKSIDLFIPAFLGDTSSGESVSLIKMHSLQNITLEGDIIFLYAVIKNLMLEMPCVVSVCGETLDHALVTTLEDHHKEEIRLWTHDNTQQGKVTEFIIRANGSFATLLLHRFASIHLQELTLIIYGDPDALSITHHSRFKPNVDLRNLVRLSISCDSNITQWAIELSKWTNLSRLSELIITYESNENVDPSILEHSLHPINLNSLTALSLYGNFHILGGQLISSLYAPQLKILELRPSIVVEHNAFFATWTHQMLSTIEHLYLSYASDNFYIYREVIQFAGKAMPSIKFLELYNADPALLLKGIMEKTNSFNLYPSLLGISLDWPERKTLKFNAWRKFKKIRNSGSFGSPLKYFGMRNDVLATTQWFSIESKDFILETTTATTWAY
jgi:hypothetical protein